MNFEKPGKMKKLRHYILAPNKVLSSVTPYKMSLRTAVKELKKYPDNTRVIVKISGELFEVYKK